MQPKSWQFTFLRHNQFAANEAGGTFVAEGNIFLHSDRELSLRKQNLILFAFLGALCLIENPMPR